MDKTTTRSSPGSAISQWLMAGALPDRPLPLDRLPPLNAELTSLLFDAAHQHRILPSLLRHVRNTPFSDDPAVHQILEKIRDERRSELVISLRLRKLSEDLIDHYQNRNCRATVVKGPVFADHLYTETHLRPFTDIDLLVALESRKEIFNILTEMGFTLLTDEPTSGEMSPEAETPEWQWRYQKDNRMLFEVHTNMVHSFRTRSQISLGIDDIESSPTSPASLLCVALVHGIVTGQYKNIGQLVDVVLAAHNLKTPEDEKCFLDYCSRDSNRAYAYIGLIVAGLILNDSRCVEIANEVGKTKWANTCARLTKFWLSYDITSRTSKTARKIVRLLLRFEGWRLKNFQ